MGDGDGDGVDVKPSVDVSAGLRSSHVRMMRVTVMGVNQAPSAGESCPGARVCIGSDYVAQGNPESSGISERRSRGTRR